MPPGHSRDDLIRTLLDPAAFPWRPPTVDLIETHMSWVVLAGDRVIKIKRPVHFGFVDHTRIEQRRHSCEEEVRLNRRMTEDVYLGTIPVIQSGNRLFVGADGVLFDWAVLMRRLPADRMLDTLLSGGSAPGDAVDLLARHLIPFHREKAAICDRETVGSAATMTAVVTANLDELRGVGGSIESLQFTLVEESMRCFMREHAPLFQQRVNEGWVKDGHGDLRAEHICLEENGPVQIFDCVEFSPSIRCADIASDLAFLLMDLDRLGAETTASGLAGRYREAGIDLPTRLLRFYQAHRALVRAKIDALTMAGGIQSHSGLADEAADYLNVAARAVLTVKPFLLAMTGLSGTGKSTVASSIACATGADLLSSDLVRKEMAGVTGPAAAAWGEGIYSADWNERTYQRLIMRADRALREGRPVVLDGTFLDKRWRELAAQLASIASTPFLLVETVCDESVVAARIAARAATETSASDASSAIHDRQRENLASGSLTIPRGAIAVRVDTSAESGNRLDPVFAALQRAEVIRLRLPADPAPR